MSTLAARYRVPTILTFPEAGASITVALHQTTDPARIALLIARLGLNESDSMFEGRLLNPLSLPSTIVAGMRANLTWLGVLGVATLQPFQDSTPQRWLRDYGQRILLSWRTDGA